MKNSGGLNHISTLNIMGGMTPNESLMLLTASNRNTGSNSRKINEQHGFIQPRNFDQQIKQHRQLRNDFKSSAHHILDSQAVGAVPLPNIQKILASSNIVNTNKGGRIAPTNLTHLSGGGGNDQISGGPSNSSGVFGGNAVNSSGHNHQHQYHQKTLYNNTTGKYQQQT